MKGIKKCSKDNLNALHQGVLKESGVVSSPKKMKISVEEKAVSNDLKKARRVVRAIAKTTEPMNSLRSPENKQLLKTLIELGEISDHRTIIAIYGNWIK